MAESRSAVFRSDGRLPCAVGGQIQIDLRVGEVGMSVHGTDPAPAGPAIAHPSDRLAASGLVFTTGLGTEMESANVGRDFRHALQLVPGIDPNE